ncbi:MAG: nitroreductase family protein [Flavobacteriales bacterium]
MLVYHRLDRRRIVRDFLDRPVSKELLENIIKAASKIPISTHKQSWTFCLVSSLR